MRLGKQDKAVIRAFTEKRALDGHKLTTDGITLDGYTWGLKHIAAWHADGKIHFQDLGSRSAQTVQNAVRKEAPKNDLAPGWTRGDRSNNPSIDPKRIARLTNPF